MLSHGCNCGKASQIIFFVAIGWALAMSAAQGAGRDGPIQVLSDVDDTLHSSGGGVKGAPLTHSLAGCDGHYPHGTIYPGVAEFYFYLAKGGQQSTEMLTPALLSARAKMLKVFLAIKAVSPDAIAVAHGASGQIPADKVRDYQSDEPRTYGLNVKGSMYGSFTLSDTVRQKDKQKHVEKFLKEYPNIPVVFVGDDGQGDCAAGMTMAKTMSGVEAVFIHAIRKYPQNKCRKNVSKCEADPVIPPLGKQPVQVPILYFDTYADAALRAYRLGLISIDEAVDVFTHVTKFFQEYCNEDGGTATTRDKTKVLDAGCEELRVSIKDCIKNSEHIRNYMATASGDKGLYAEL